MIMAGEMEIYLAIRPYTVSAFVHATAPDWEQGTHAPCTMHSEMRTRMVLAIDDMQARAVCEMTPRRPRKATCGDFEMSHDCQNSGILVRSDLLEKPFVDGAVGQEYRRISRTRSNVGRL